MTRPRILVAGVGNVFFGDDGFGVRVVERLRTRQPGDGVEVVDFGIRGFDLACALLDRYDAAILVDAVPRGRPPGTLYVIEPDLPDAGTTPSQPVAVDAHGLHLAQVLQSVHALGGRVPWVRIVGCEPANFGSEDEPRMELSPEVQGALGGAVELIESLLAEIPALFSRQSQHA